MRILCKDGRLSKEASTALVDTVGEDVIRGALEGDTAALKQMALSLGYEPETKAAPEPTKIPHVREVVKQEITKGRQRAVIVSTTGTKREILWDRSRFDLPMVKPMDVGLTEEARLTLRRKAKEVMVAIFG